MKNIIREVWKYNLEEEFNKINSLATSPCSHCIAIDTEFPGFLHNTPFGSSEEQRYRDMKLNVDAMKIIQCGFTFFNSCGYPRTFTWQVNFREFNPTVDPHAKTSIQLLRASGINFEQIQHIGVDSRLFSKILWEKLVLPCRYRTRWVTFHGLYDVAYLLKLLTGRPLPKTLPEFLHQIRSLMGSVYDIKYMVKFYGFDERFGLLKLAEKLGVRREGKHHQAGHDSLMIIEVFSKLKEKFGLREDYFAGIIYGVQAKSLELMRGLEYF